MKTIKIPIETKPCEICGRVDYKFVPFICDAGRISFELRCRNCDKTRKELYEVIK